MKRNIAYILHVANVNMVELCEGTDIDKRKHTNPLIRSHTLTHAHTLTHRTDLNQRHKHTHTRHKKTKPS